MMEREENMVIKRLLLPITTAVLLLPYFTNAHEPICGAKVIFVADSSSDDDYYIDYESVECRRNREKKVAAAEFRKPTPITPFHYLYISPPSDYWSYSVIVRKSNTVIARGIAGKILPIDIKYKLPFDVYVINSETADKEHQFRIEDESSVLDESE
jgi:hypothetical protein